MSIKLRLLLLIGFFIGVFFINVIAINMWVLGAQDANQLITIAERQQMLSQKMAKASFMTLAGTNSDAERDETMRLFESNLLSLMSGKDKVSDDRVKGQLEVVRREWKAVKGRLNRLSLQTGVDDKRAIAREVNELLDSTHRVVELLGESTTARFSRLKVIAFGFLVVALAAAISGGIYLQKFVIGRIENIKNVSESIVNAKDLTIAIECNGKDEIASTAHAFDYMVKDFSSFNRETLNVEQELQKQLEMLAITTQENRNSMDIQRSEIMQVSTAVNEMATTIQEVARNTQEAARVASKAQDEANHGSELLESSMQLTHSLAREVRDAADNIEKLAQASDSIGGIADTISTIAEQTNLLALNAAIEAARAGEQGRGFAVVADEVRTLAQRTQEATSEIHKLISTLQETTQVSVETMENSKVRSEQGVEQAENMSDALKAVIESVQYLGNVNHQIAVSAEEQTVVADEINQNIVKIESKAENTLSNAEATAQYSENLSAMASQLRARLSEYKVV